MFKAFAVYKENVFLPRIKPAKLINLTNKKQL